MKQIQILSLIGLVVWCITCGTKRPSSLRVVQICKVETDTCKCVSWMFSEEKQNKYNAYNVKTKRFNFYGTKTDSIDIFPYLYKVDTITLYINE